MKIAIVSTNRNRNPVPVMPLGACIAAEAAERAGHEARVLDLMFDRRGLEGVKRDLAAFQPDVVGLSIRNIDNNDLGRSVVYLEEAAAISRLVRESGRAITVLGGAAVGLMPEALLRLTGADYAVTGYAERVFPMLLSELSLHGTVRSDIPGVACLVDGDYRGRRYYPAPGACPLSMPDLGRWIEMKAYTAGMGSVPIQTKRGCPFQCVYCTYPLAEGAEYRVAEAGSVTETIARYARQGMNDFEFVDNVFNSPPAGAAELCGRIISEKLRVRLHTMELNPAFLDDALLGLMERAGFVSVGITVESASDAVLEGLGKEYGAAEVHRAAELIARRRLSCLWMFMLGGPGETQETVIETLEFARKHVRGSDVAFFIIGIRIYPETRLEALARRQGVLRVERRDMLDPVFYVAPGLDPCWIAKALSRYMRARPNLINSHFIGLPYAGVIQRAAYRLGVRPPMWRHVGCLRRSLKLIGVDA